MKELARKMAEVWKSMVMDELWLMNAISNYCFTHKITLTEEEECELIEIFMDEEY